MTPKEKIKNLVEELSSSKKFKFSYKIGDANYFNLKNTDYFLGLCSCGWSSCDQIYLKKTIKEFPQFYLVDIKNANLKELPSEITEIILYNIDLVK